jgi:hypothetical protein
MPAAAKALDSTTRPPRSVRSCSPSFCDATSVSELVHSIHRRGSRRAAEAGTRSDASVSQPRGFSPRGDLRAARFARFPAG